MERNFDGLRDDLNLLSKNEELILERMAIKQYTLLDSLKDQVTRRRDAMVKNSSTKSIMRKMLESTSLKKHQSQKSDITMQNLSDGLYLIDENRSMESSKLMLPKGAIEYN
jgi:hypothetical protein